MTDRLRELATGWRAEAKERRRFICATEPQLLVQLALAEEDDLHASELEAVLVREAATEPPTDDERVPAQPRQVMAYRPVVTSVRAASRPLSDPHEIVRFSQMDMDKVTKPLHVEIERLQAATLSPPAQTPRVEARRDQPDGAEPHRWLRKNS